MIQLIVKLGKWLESRFPPKLLVLESDYRELKSRVDELADCNKNISILITRMSAIEQSAAHTDAVKIIIAEMVKLKEEFTTLKTGLGLSRIQDADVQAMLNGMPVTPEDK